MPRPENKIHKHVQRGCPYMTASALAKLGGNMMLLTGQEHGPIVIACMELPPG
jgi:hypothetical protein